MHRSHTAVLVAWVTGCAICGLFAALAAQEREQFTDFRDQVYSVDELERALFPDAAPRPRMRGLEPQPQHQPPPTKVAVALNVFFEFNSDKILPRYYADLEKLGKVLERHTEEHFYLEGHTDNIGADAYNQLLSEKRAESVKRYLVQSFAIPPGRISTKGYGKSQPRATNDTDQGRHTNRRVEVVRK